MREDVGAILEARAEAHPDRTLFCFYAGDESQRERYSYGSFLRRVNFVARSLAESGIAPGQPALLVYPPGLEMAVAFFACVLIGAVPLPAPPPAQAKRNAGWGRLAHIARHAGAVHVLAPATLAARVASQRARLDDASVVDALSGLRWYPLLSFFDRNTGRIQRMGDKRYDSSDYRRMRDHDRLALAHPPIEDTVGSIVSYLRREGLIPDAAGASDGSKTTAGAIG